MLVGGEAVHFSRVMGVVYDDVVDPPPSPEIHLKKMALNEEFLTSAHIQDAVAVLFCTNNQVQLEVEGRSYDYTCISGALCERSSIDQKMRQAARRGCLKYPFIRFGISVTPLELRCVRDDVQQGRPVRYALNCADRVRRVIGRTTGFAIPFAASVLPSHMALYLRAKKALGSHRITSMVGFDTAEWPFGELVEIGGVGRAVRDTLLVGMAIFGMASRAINGVWGGGQ